MSTIKDLIITLREDYLDDNDPAKYLWSDASLLRKFTEAERQACNRANLIFDDSTNEYVRITLVEGQASYSLSQKLTTIESIIFDGDYVTKTTRDNLDSVIPSWRTDTGMTGNAVYAVISGRKLRVSPIPDASDVGKYIYLEVHRLPDVDITNVNQEPEIPSENHSGLNYWVLHECYKKQDADTFDQEKADYYLGRFDEIFGPPVSAKVRQHQFENPRSLMLIPKVNSTVSEEEDDW